MTTPARTIQVWKDTVTPDVCKHRSCQASVLFAVNVKSGKTGIYDAPLAIVGDETRDMLTGRAIVTVDLDTSHFITCPASKSFRRSR